MNGEQYTIVLRGEKSDVPTIIRLRKALKVLLRSFGLRCVSVEASGQTTENFAATSDDEDVR